MLRQVRLGETYGELREASGGWHSAKISILSDISQYRHIPHSCYSDRITKVPSSSTAEDIVPHCPSKHPRICSIIHSPVHRSNSDSDLEEVGVGGDDVVLDDGVGESSRERREIDHVDSTESLSRFCNDRVAANCGSSRSKDHDGTVRRVCDDVASYERIPASERNSIRLKESQQSN